MTDRRPGGLSRRDLLKRAAGTAAWAGGGFLGNSSAETIGQGQRNDAAADLVLVNGTFVDGRGAIATALAIGNGRIVKAGRREEMDPAGRTIDLGGRTVVPGFFDAHVHYLRAGVNPGFEARRIERAFSIAELQEAIAQRAAQAPPDACITCIGGWNHTQLAERRRPTKAELDEAAPKHAVYISGTGGGTGGLANSRGRAFLTGKGVMVDETTGLVGSAASAVAALQSAQTTDDKIRGTADLNRHANSLGLTGVINAGNTADQEHTLHLWREGKLTVRVRQVLGADNAQEAETRGLADLGQPARSDRGDGLFKVVGFGERLGGMDTMSPQFEATARAIAKHRWLLQQHSITTAENDFHLAAFRAIAREFSLEGLRWSLLHLQQIDAARLQALKVLGVGASAQTWTYLSEGGGPPFRRILDSGIRAGVGTDSTNVSALDPWLSLFYMTTGRNLSGALTNDGQQISRLEALRLYTEGAAWFSFDDDQVGSFVPGRYADLAVLSHDFLTVPEQSIRKIESVLTLVGGRVVHATGTFAALREQN